MSIRKPPYLAGFRGIRHFSHICHRGPQNPISGRVLASTAQTCRKPGYWTPISLCARGFVAQNGLAPSCTRLGMSAAKASRPDTKKPTKSGLFQGFSLRQSRILATTPAPTVRPPSRIAKRRPSSIAIGAINSATKLMLSPGITISTPSGNSTAPVTSVVRK